jgi:uncharacterized protein (DUF169 family)
MRHGFHNHLNILGGMFVEGREGRVNLEDLTPAILERVCQYFYYKLRYTQTMKSIPEFTVEPEMALELLMAANFLDT